MIDSSTFLIVTGGWEMPRTQLVSHGAGQMRPVNSGKLFVACSRSAASSHCPRHTRSFHSGMRLPSTDPIRSEEHTSELQSRPHLVCRLLLEKKKNKKQTKE